MIKKGLIFILMLFCLLGCKTTRQVEQTTIANALDSTKQVTSVISIQHDSVYVHDSVYIEYKIGRIDTLNFVRVDTLYKYKEKTAYRGENTQKTHIDTLIQVRTDTLISTKTETKIKEVAQKVSLWKRLQYLLVDAIAAILLLLLVKYIKCK